VNDFPLKFIDYLFYLFPWFGFAPPLASHTLSPSPTSLLAHPPRVLACLLVGGKGEEKGKTGAKGHLTVLVSVIFVAFFFSIRFLT
jgi:hypothetical protein